MVDLIKTRQGLDQLLKQATNYEQQPDFHKGRVRFDLSGIREYCTRLGHPESSSPVVHVTGTKGKGSTASLITRILVAHGERVGLHTSPHLERMEERVTIDFEAISEADLLGLTNLILDTGSQLSNPGFPTFFEYMTLIAFLHFRKESVNYAVHEVGLGGRLDATNVVLPAVCVVTNVALEHTRVLGDRLEDIAVEKAGIVKGGAPLVLGVSEGEPTFDIFAGACDESGGTLRVLGRDIEVTAFEPAQGCGSTISVRTWRGHYRGLSSLLSGEAQASNLALAIGAVEALMESGGATIDADTLKRSLCEFSIPGRMEVLAREPLVMVDGAHTPESIRLAVREARRIHRSGRLVILLAIAEDKDLPACVAALKGAGAVIATRYQNPRAADPEHLTELVQGTCDTAESISDPKLALDRACDLAEKKGVVLVLGSMYLAGAIRSVLRNGDA